jgi:hypothetical protein
MAVCSLKSNPVMKNAVCVGDTNIPVEILFAHFFMGWSDNDIRYLFPSLKPYDIALLRRLFNELEGSRWLACK